MGLEGVFMGSIMGSQNIIIGSDHGSNISELSITRDVYAYGEDLSLS